MVQRFHGLFGPSGSAPHRALNRWDRVVTRGMAGRDGGLSDDPPREVSDGCGDAVLLRVDAGYVSETSVDVVDLGMRSSGSARRPGEDDQVLSQQPGEQLP